MNRNWKWMSSLKTTYHTYHPMVWLLVVGTIFSRLASTMTMPFLALYLAKNTHMSMGLIGVTVGIGSLAGMFGGFIGGMLSDKFGRKKIMLTSLYLGVFVFAGFGMAHQVWMFPVLNAINGIVRVFFEPIAQAVIGDVTSPELRGRAFGLRYLGINIGATAGPMLGAFLGMSGSGIGFWITSATNLIYAVILSLFMQETLPGFTVGGKGGNSNEPKSNFMLKDAVRVVFADRSLFFFILAGIVANFGYSQINSTLPIFMRQLMPQNGDFVYSSLNTINALQVVLIQIPMSHWMEKRSPLINCVWGSLLFGLGYMVFGVSSSWWMFALGMIVLTFGEILNFTSGSQILDQLAGEQLRGTYFGASNFRNLGMFLGPAVGLSLLPKIGGIWMFLIIGISVAASSYLYVIGNRIWEAKQTQVGNSNALNA